MERWQKEFVDFMKEVGEYDDIAFIVESGKRNQDLANKIMQFVRNNEINTFDMWKEDTTEKYDKYLALFEMVLANNNQGKQQKTFSTFKKQ